MNVMKTAMLLAALTALFGVVGYLLGGQGGMLIALGIAAVTNLFAYWNSDKLALAAHHAVEVDERTAPELVGMVAGPVVPGGPADAARLSHRQPATQRLRHRPQPAERRRRGHHRPLADDVLRGARRRHGARARAYQEPRHADHDGDGHGRRRHLDHRPVRLPVRRPRPSQSARHDRHRHPGAARRHGHPDGHQPLARIRRRPDRRGDLRRSAVAGLRARQARGGGGADPQPGGGAASRDRAPLHRQSAQRPRHGQPVLDPSEYREPHRRPAGACR